MYIGIDIGGTKTAVLLTNSQLESVAQTQHQSRGQTLLPDLTRAIKQLLKEAKVPHSHIAGIGIGIPGEVDPLLGQVSTAVNLQIDQPLPLAKLLSAEFNVPVYMENDVRLAALAVQRRLGVANVAYLNIGTGVSAGVVLNGRLHRGISGMAGEIGHIPINSEQEILENIVSGFAIERQALAQGLTVQHAGDVYRLAKQGDTTAQQIITRVSTYVSQAILWLVMAYDIEKLVIGGGVTQSGDAFFTPVLTELDQLRRHSPIAQQMVPNSKIELLDKNENAGLWGAVRLAREAVQSTMQSQNNHPAPAS